MKKPLIRRTLSQERYEVLIKRQRNGVASFKDLTELDEIVNRDPTIREIVLDEMQGVEPPDNDLNKPDAAVSKGFAPANLFQKIRNFFKPGVLYTGRLGSGLFKPSLSYMLMLKA